MSRNGSSNSGGSGSSTLHSEIPSDVTLFLKASCEERMKRIRFSPNIQLLCFNEFQLRISHALQFDDVDFAITWQDDDGEHCEITNDDDLREALLFFSPSTQSSVQPPTPITMRVSVRVETAVSLSDFGSSTWGGSDDSIDDEREGNGSRMTGSEASYRSDRISHTAVKARSKDHASSSLCTWNIGRGESTLSLTRSPSGSDMISLHGSSPLSHEWKASHRGGMGRHASLPSPPSPRPEASDELESLSSLSLHPANAFGPRGRGRDRKTSSDSSSSNSDSDDSVNTRAPRVKRLLAGGRRSSRAMTTAREEPNGFNVHVNVRCHACKRVPIVGVRYHCASCVKGADFCAECEQSGNAVRRSTNHVESHIMIKLSTPLADVDVADMMGNVLHATSRRLAREVNTQQGPASSSSSTSSGQTQSTDVTSISQATQVTLLCSFCTAPITTGSRYLCANCPIVGEAEGARDGYSLCPSCEVHSLKIHDPAHFFLKLSIMPFAHNSSRIPLGDRWDVQEMTNAGGGALLPCLYSNLESFESHMHAPIRPRNTLSRTPDGVHIPQPETNAVQPRSASLDDVDESSPAYQQAHWLTPWCSRSMRGRDIELHAIREANAHNIVPLDRLVHPSILCDSCFHVIHGAWFRCCHCTSSYDLCGPCMARIAHDPTHAFAAFKQPVDLDLFKSCVDHQDVGDRTGSSRPMLPFPLT